MDISDCFIVILQTLIGLRSHVNVEPNDLAVVCAQHKVVSSWVDRDAGYPLAAGLILRDDLLLLQIILEHMHVRASEEMWLRRMERDSLYYSFRLSEWTS